MVGYQLRNDVGFPRAWARNRPESYDVNEKEGEGGWRGADGCTVLLRIDKAFLI